MARLSDHQDQPQIRTAEQAIDRGGGFLAGHGYAFKRPMSARREADHWVVLFDTSLVGPKQVVRMTIDSQTGDITEFTDLSFE